VGRVFWTVYGLETVGLRYFNVFGRHQDPASQYTAVTPRFILALNELVEILNRLLDSVIEPIHGPPRRCDVERSWPDISRATQRLGYHPTVGFEQGLRRTLAAYEED
jgi:UDP-N-acetylglucosamine 4-epimerase